MKIHIDKKMTLFYINKVTITEKNPPSEFLLQQMLTSISDEYHQDVDRQSILSVIMEVIADGFDCLGLRDIFWKKNFFPD